MKLVKLLKKRVSFGLFSAIVLLPLCGCIQTLSLLSVPLTALQLGTMVYQSVEKAEVNATVASGVTEKDLRKIKHIAILLGQESNTPSFGKIGELKAVVGDNLSIQLTKIGFLVSDGSKLEKSTLINLAEAGYSTNNVVKAGRALGVQAIVTGNVTAAQHSSFGVIGVGRMNTVVQSASMKVIGMEKADILIVVTANYKVGQNPQAAAKGIAKVLKEKFKNPKSDVMTSQVIKSLTNTESHLDINGRKTLKESDIGDQRSALPGQWQG